MESFHISSFKKNVLILFSGTLIAQGIPIAISPILTRLYQPDDFGILAIYLAVISVLSIFFTGRYELAIVLGKNESNAKNLFFAASLLSFFSFLIISVVFLFLIEDITNVLKIDAAVVYLMPVGALVISISQLSNYYLNRQALYKKMAISKVFQSSSSASYQLFTSKTFSFSLVFGDFFGRLIALIYQLNILSFIFKKEPRLITVKKMISMLKIRKDHPKFLMTTAIIETGSNQALPIVISSLFGTTLLGYYSLATRTLSAPMALLGTSIGQVFFKEFTKTNTDENRKQLLFSVWSKLFLIGILPFTLLFLYGKPLFLFVFGDGWSIAGEIAMILSPMLLVMFVSSPTSTCYIVLGLNHLLIRFGIITFFYRIIALFYGYIQNDFFSVLYILVLCEIFKIIFFNFIALKKLK